MIKKRCTRCGLILPASRFRKNTALKGGLDSWCESCRRRATREWEKENPWYKEAENALLRKSADAPLLYSRGVIEHVGAYVDRAIKRFEKRTQKEAPPHLVALRQITDAFIAEHPSKERYCPDCGVLLTRKYQRSCDSCRHEKRLEHWQRKNIRRQWGDVTWEEQLAERKRRAVQREEEQARRRELAKARREVIREQQRQEKENDPQRQEAIRVLRILRSRWAEGWLLRELADVTSLSMNHIYYYLRHPEAVPRPDLLLKLALLEEADRPTGPREAKARRIRIEV